MKSIITQNDNYAINKNITGLSKLQDNKAKHTGTSVKEVKTSSDKTKFVKQCPYMVKVQINDLRILTGPGTEYTWTGKYVNIGTYIIIEVKNDWGRLKSGEGWSSLNYCTVV